MINLETNYLKKGYKNQSSNICMLANFALVIIKINED